MDRPRFIYRGNAVGAAGHIEKPDDTILWVQGASSLPVIGGYARSAGERVNFPEYLTVENTKTETNGAYSEREKAFRTIATSSVQRVNITKRLQVDLLEATLISSHPVDGREPTIVPGGTVIKNMRIDGYPVNVKIDIEFFTKYCTMSSLSKAYADDDAFFKRYGKRFWSRDPQSPPPPVTPPPAKAAKGPSGKDASKQAAPGKRQIPTVAGYVLCSVVHEVQTDHPKITVDGHVLTLPGFGRIFLGELLVTGVSRRLTLLRAKLGSPVTGDIACAEVENNGIIVI